MEIKLIAHNNQKNINLYMIHRMLCFNYEKNHGVDTVNVKTFIKINGLLTDIFEQKQIGTHISAVPSYDILKYYLINKYDEYDDEVWEEMNNDGDHKVITLEVEVIATPVSE